MDGKYLDRERLFEQRTPVVVIWTCTKAKKTHHSSSFVASLVFSGKKKNNTKNKIIFIFLIFLNLNTQFLLLLLYVGSAKTLKTKIIFRKQQKEKHEQRKPSFGTESSFFSLRKTHPTNVFFYLPGIFAVLVLSPSSRFSGCSVS